MVTGRVVSRITRNLFSLRRSSSLISGRSEIKDFPSPTNFLIQPRGFSSEVIPGSMSLLHQPAMKSSSGQWFGFSSFASPQANAKEAVQPENGVEIEGDSETVVDGPQQTEASVPNESEDSDLETDLSKEDLVKLVMEKENLLSAKQEEVTQMKDKVLRTLAEMENVKERTRRESDNAKKFAIQNFAKGLLDVADNLGRAASAAKESFSKIDTSQDTIGAPQQLKTLLEGVEMTEKQLVEVFKKHGLEKYNPVDEEFDPNRHNAVFQVPTSSKPEGLVGVVLKAGYVLHGRVVRPAEVGVTVVVEKKDSEAA